MSIGVFPTFYEEGIFDSSGAIQRRIIHNKYIYAIDRVHMNGERYTETYFVQDGKLKKLVPSIGSQIVIDVPIMPGTHYLFVSKHNLLNNNRLLKRDNSDRIMITDQTDQEITLRFPMCYHSNDGAREAAEYIYSEIWNNSQSEQVRLIFRMNDLEGRIAEWKRLSPLQQALNAIPKNMKAEALLLWAGLVGPNRIWDHKPDISGERGGHRMEDHAVWRPNRRGGAFHQKFYHKYGDHDYYYDVWSNIHYGYVGKAAGFTDNELLDGAGLAQLITDFPSPRVHDETVTGLRKWDDIPDQRIIELGIRLFERTGGNVERLTAQMFLDGLVELGNRRLPNNSPLLGDSRVKHICCDDDGFTQD